MKMKKLVLISLLFVLVAACGRKDKSVMPERLLNEKEMISLMTDLQIVEADINYRKTKGENTEGLAKEYYNQLFEHHEITDSIFVQNMRYYTERPAILERIMDSVVLRLTKEPSGKP